MTLKWNVVMMMLAFFGAVVSQGQTMRIPGTHARSAMMNEISIDRQIVSWRAGFRESQDPERLRVFRNTMAEASARMNDDPRAMAFLATAEILTASHRFNPISKWKGFRKWTAVLDKQVLLVPHDPDIRFLRMTIQVNAPGFLGYGDAIPSDCRIVHASLADGYWNDDPSHHSFVEEIYLDSQACL